MNLPAQLKAWRSAHDLTQTAAAARLGVNLNTLQNWEAGRNTPRGLALATLLSLITLPVQKRRPARVGRVTKPNTGTRAETRGGKKKVTNETSKSKS
jgi:transcriptional regulator with XRE-family HTH domain